MIAATDPKPTLLGSYALEELLGQGGMGDVWRAVLGPHPSPSSVVAMGGRSAVCIKVIKQELARNEKAVDMFLREAKLAARLHHPGIVRILELGRDQGTYFIVMEMLEGMAWHDIAQRCWRHGKTLPLEAIVRAAAEAAYALDYAHTLVGADGQQLGMVHRDISPDNLFLTAKGPTKVLDFGVAKATSVDATQLTARGELRGKLPYMPPEQVRTDDVDGRADQWALGISLYYLTTAQRPFDRESPIDTMNAIMTLAPASVQSMNPRVPPQLAMIIERALAKHPSGRFPSARTMGDELLSLLPVAVDDSVMQRLLRDTERLERGDRRPLSAAPSAPLWQWPRRPPVGVGFDMEPATREFPEGAPGGNEFTPFGEIGMLSTAAAPSFDLGDVVSDHEAGDGVAATIRMPRLMETASPIAETIRVPLLIADTSRHTSRHPSRHPALEHDVTMMEIPLLPSGSPKTMADAAQSTAEALGALGTPSIESFGDQLRAAIPTRPTPLPRPASPPAAMPPARVPLVPRPEPIHAGIIAFAITAVVLVVVVIVAVVIIGPARR